MTDATMTRAISSQTRAPSATSRWTRSMTWPTRSGCASEAAAPTTLRMATTTSTFLCSSRKGSSWRNVARGPSCCAPRPRRRAGAVRDMEDLDLGGRARKRYRAPLLLSAVLLMRRLLRDAEGARDGLPGVPGQARAAHLRFFGARDLAPDVGEPVQFGDRLPFGVRGKGGADAHGVNIS